MDYEVLAGPAGGDDNMGGTKQFFYFAPLADFDVIGAPVGSPSTLAQRIEISDTHTFLTGKGFLTCYCTMDKGSLETSVQGDRDGRSYKQTAKFFYPGSETEAHGFASQAKNDRFIVLVPMPDGKMIQMGSADFYAEIVGKFGTGTNSSGARGYEFEIESMAPSNYVYTGTVTLKP